MNKQREMPCATACVWGGRKAPHIRGVVNFYPRDDRVLVTARVTGLPCPGFFAFHIHAGKSCGGEDFALTESHYDTGGHEHPMHAGDLPPLLSCGGEACMSVVTDRFTIREILGRTVVIHSDPDDFHTQPAGNAGEKIACGVIRAR